MAHAFENVIKALERHDPGPGWAPGTLITRIILENKVALSYGLKPTRDERGAASAWCVALGKPGEPKRMFYGWTLAEAVRNAAISFTKKRRTRSSQRKTGSKP